MKLQKQNVTKRSFSAKHRIGFFTDEKINLSLINQKLEISFANYDNDTNEINLNLTTTRKTVYFITKPQKSKQHKTKLFGPKN